MQVFLAETSWVISCEIIYQSSSLDNGTYTRLESVLSMYVKFTLGMIRLHEHTGSSTHVLFS